LSVYPAFIDPAKATRMKAFDFSHWPEGRAFATSFRGPWRLIYYEAYLDEEDAQGRERYLKSGGGRRFLMKQLSHYLAKHPIRLMS